MNITGLCHTLSLLEKFIELNKVMWSVNQGLSKTYTYGSMPKDWPVLHRGISFWSKNNLKIYLLGNPLVFWLSSLCIMTYVAMKLIIAILSKRNIMRSSYFMNGRWQKYDAAAGLFFVAWAIHYFPFNVMERQLFLHHYMPALYMATLIVGVFFDMLTSTFSSRVRLALVVIISMAVIYVYHIYIPITYGEPWSSQQCLQATWRSSWDFNCKCTVVVRYHWVSPHYKIMSDLQKGKDSTTYTKVYALLAKLYEGLSGIVEKLS
ncbi:glycosyltransferase family 39 protein [Backusella circina FSU 941]|nr:glycosyltransferase family 39 protein [Backusella circina FSU 941]